MRSLIRNTNTITIQKRNAVVRYDPTRTLYLRKAFIRDFNKRFRALRGVIRRAIVDQDCFGMQEKEFKVTVLTASDVSLPHKEAFAFPRSEEKVNAFMNWLQGQEAKGILEVGTMQQIGTSIETAWTNKYIKDSYQRGVQRARQEMKAAGYKVPSISETGGISASMTNPFHMDRLGVLYSRVFQELKGITSQMDTQISRVLSQGIADGENPRKLAKLLTKTISGPVGDLGITDTLGRFIPAERRAQTLARTEIIRAHHQGNIQEMRNWAVEGVKVKAEWVTAGYKVCPECSALEGKVFSLDEIQNKIPLHPNCRCCAIPVRKREDVLVWTTGMPWEEDRFEKMASQLHLKVKETVLDEKFIRDYVVLDRDVFVYHGVGKENLQSVLKNGIRPSTHPGNARGVYFGSKELAETWRGKGKTVAIKVRIPAGTRLYADMQPNAVFVRRAVPTSWFSEKKMLDRKKEGRLLEAERWILTNGIADNVDYSSLTVSAANEVNAAFQQLQADQLFRKKIHRLYAYTKEKEYAETDQLASELGVNSKWFNNKSAFIAHYKKTIINPRLDNFSFPLKNYDNIIKWAVDHEYGHLLMREKDILRTRIPTIYRKYQRELRRRSEKGIDYSDIFVSIRGHLNIKEFTAECFSMYRNGEYVSPYAEEVFKEIRKTLSKLPKVPKKAIAESSRE